MHTHAYMYHKITVPVHYSYGMQGFKTFAGLISWLFFGVKKCFKKYLSISNSQKVENYPKNELMQPSILPNLTKC